MSIIYFENAINFISSRIAFIWKTQLCFKTAYKCCFSIPIQMNTGNENLQNLAWILCHAHVLKCHLKFPSILLLSLHKVDYFIPYALSSISEFEFIITHDSD